LGSPKFVEGKTGKALKLSGLDDWVEVYNDPVFDSVTDNLTIEFYIKPDKWYIENPIVTRANQFGVTQTQPDSLSFYINRYQNLLTVAVPADWLNNWHNVKAVYADKKMQLFIDGELKGEKEYSWGFRYTKFPVNIGRDYFRNGSHHLGWISNCAVDEVKISKVNEGTKEKQYLLDSSFDENYKKEKAVYYGSDSFDCNGVVFHDRTPQPELFQVKKSQSPVRFKLLNENKHEIEISNFYSFTNLNELSFNYYLYKNGKIIKKGGFDIDCLPLSKTTYTLPLEIDGNDADDLILEVTANVKKDCAWAKTGHEIGFEQFQLTNSHFQLQELQKAKDKTKISDNENSIEVKLYDSNFSYIIDKTNGQIKIVSGDNKNPYLTGPELNVWRSPISNELSGWGRSEAEPWYRTGLNRLRNAETDFNYDINNNELNTTTKIIYTLPENDDIITSEFIYKISSTGVLTITHNIEFLGYFNYEWLPRIGMKFIVPESFNKVKWYGRGPFENYPDRKTGAKIGIYELPVGEFYVPYVETENFGNRTDVKSLTIAADDDKVLLVGEDKLNFSLNPFNNLDRTVYPFQLQKDGNVELNIDYKITGVGGTPVPTLPKYRTYPGKYSYTINIYPYKEKAE
jgi:beta-galactosidase